MADLPAFQLTCTNLATPGAAAAARIQINLVTGGGSLTSLLADFELTGAQNTALVNGLNASPATTTTLSFAAAPAVLPGIYNAQ